MPKRNPRTRAGGASEGPAKPVEKARGAHHGAISDNWVREKAATIDRLLMSIEAKLEKPEFKASIGDFIRLLQLKKEMEEEQPREITVRWLGRSEKEDASVA